MAVKPEDLAKLNLSKAGLEKQNEQIAIENRLKAQADERDRAYQDMLARRAAGDAEGSKKAEKKWHEFREQYKQDLNETVAGYDTLVAVLNKMMKGMFKLSAAIRASLPVGYIARVLTSWATDQIGYGTHYIRHALQNQLTGADENADIPHLQYFVDLDPNDNTLSVDSLAKNLIRSDGEKFTKQQQQDFEMNVKGWLENVDGGKYDVVESIQGSNRVYKVVDRITTPGVEKELDQAAFRALRDDPVQGLTAYLDKKLKLNFKHLPEDPSDEPAPSPGGP